MHREPDPSKALGPTEDGFHLLTSVPAPRLSRIYEVGWQSRHSFVDVRPAEQYDTGRVRGSYSVPLEPSGTFLERAEAAIVQIHHEQPPAQHLARSSVPRAETPTGNDDFESPKMVRLIVGGDDTSSAAFSACQALLQGGYKNTLALAVGFDEWKRLGLPCDDLLDDEGLPDSTF